MPTKTAYRVKSKTAIITISVIIILATSLLVANMISPGIISNFASSAKQPIIPPSGWCVTEFSETIGGNISGSHKTLTDCVGREYDDNPNTVWYAFCPDIVGEDGKLIPRKESECGCNYTDIAKSKLLIEIIDGRNNLIDQLNDGDITAEDYKKEMLFKGAIRLQCACEVFHAGNAPTGADAERKLTTITYSSSFNPSGSPVKGVFSFTNKVAIMLSKMNDGVAPNCNLFPADYPKCRIGRSYSGSGSYVSPTIWNGNNGSEVENPTYSLHSSGQAVDLNCQDLNKPEDTGCTGDTESLLQKIYANANGLHIIRECTRQERIDCKASSASERALQVIHVEESTRRGLPSDGATCIYNGCTNRGEGHEGFDACNGYL